MAFRLAWWYILSGAETEGRAGRERERERKGGEGKSEGKSRGLLERVRARVCVWLCVRERARETAEAAPGTLTKREEKQGMHFLLIFILSLLLLLYSSLVHWPV